MATPDRLINLAMQLSEEQMKSLQTSLDFVDPSDRDEKFKKVEEILTDYRLPTDTLSEVQIEGFADFVNES